MRAHTHSLFPFINSFIKSYTRLPEIVSPGPSGRGNLAVSSFKGTDVNPQEQGKRPDQHNLERKES